MPDTSPYKPHVVIGMFKFKSLLEQRKFSSLELSYFASKACTYTDASGRPVPAPHKVPSEPSSSSTAHAKQVAGMEFLVHSGPGSYQPGESSSPRTVLELGPEEPGSSRKRYRADPSYPHSGVSPSGEPIPRDPMLAPQPINTVFEGPSGMDPSLTRELVNRQLLSTTLI